MTSGKLKMQPEKRYILPDRIFTGETWMSGEALILDGSRMRIDPVAGLPPSANVERFPSHFVAPAFIDLQVYGAAGKLLGTEPTVETLRAMEESAALSGTAYFLPTVATNTREAILRSVDAVKEYWSAGGQAVLGLHLEGPWINPEKRGAHVKDLIREPRLEDVIDVVKYCKGVIKMITLAPEICSDEILKLLGAENIIISAGHSAASFDEARRAFRNGVRCVTHLYNAMSPFHHREPGVVGAVFADESVMASIIPDGHHVRFEAITVAKNLIGDRLFAITDAVTDTAGGFYLHNRVNDRYEVDGVLSGSAITMFQAFRNLVGHCRIEAGEALRMCSLYPARLLGRPELGMIAAGTGAPLVLIDNDLRSVRLI
ncbi:MAG TPA: N-acetylglucosamine-6-phosphate deacetylase [Chitinophagaceae bacterium]|nr:N-acetylglucosamine-6-phosphate deacetylase [Chitinophagaceae bacterium]